MGAVDDRATTRRGREVEDVNDLATRIRFLAEVEGDPCVTLDTQREAEEYVQQALLGKPPDTGAVVREVHEVARPVAVFVRSPTTIHMRPLTITVHGISPWEWVERFRRELLNPLDAPENENWWRRHWRKWWTA